jgi:hypothetical protein
MADFESAASTNSATWAYFVLSSWFLVRSSFAMPERLASELRTINLELFGGAILRIAAILSKIPGRYFANCAFYLQQLFLGSSSRLTTFHILLKKDILRKSLFQL